MATTTTTMMYENYKKNERLVYMDELKRMTQYWRDYQFENEKGLYQQMDNDDIEIDSPFVLYKLCDAFEDEGAEYDYLPEIVKCDYHNLLVEYGGVGIIDYCNTEKLIEWVRNNRRNIQTNIAREKLLMMYGRVPNDIINEMLSFM